MPNNRKTGYDVSSELVYDLFNKKIYEIPRNQRNYVWTNRNLEELFNDILFYKENKQKTHFLGSIVLKSSKRKNGIPSYIIIDGQQRIFTITILMCCLLYWFKYINEIKLHDGIKNYILYKDDESEEVPVIQSENSKLIKDFINNVIESNHSEIISKSYESFVESSNYYPKENEKQKEVFLYFLYRIDGLLKNKKNKKEYLTQLRDSILNMTYINITAGSEEDAYTIFEILNARGLVLADSELLKNYVMRYYTPAKNVDDAKKQWMQIESLLGKYLDRFIKHYAIHKFGDINTYDNNSYKAIQDNTKDRNTKALLQDLLKKAKYYEKLVNPSNDKEYGNCQENEYRVFKFFKRKRQEQFRPVLLSVLHQKEENKINDEKYNKLIEYIWHYFICYCIIGSEKSNKLTNTINKYANKIENNFDENTINNFIKELNEKLPSKNNFESSFKNIGWSHHGGVYEDDRYKDKCKIILEAYERINKGMTNEDFTIEHIFNDEATQTTSQIGNLLPLEERINNKCDSLDLEDKINYYIDSNFKSTKEFYKRYNKKLDEFNPDKRTIQICNQIYNELESNLKTKIK